MRDQLGEIGHLGVFRRLQWQPDFRSRLVFGAARFRAQERGVALQGRVGLLVRLRQPPGEEWIVTVVIIEPGFERSPVAVGHFGSAGSAALVQLRVGIELLAGLLDLLFQAVHLRRRLGGFHVFQPPAGFFQVDDVAGERQ